MLTKHSAPVLDIKSITEEGVITGYGSIFGNKDGGGDIVMPGAYSKSLAEHRRKGTSVKMFWQHNPNEPIGKWTDLAEDGKGLYVEGKLNMGVQRAREAYSLLKDGDIEGLSIGYRVVTEEQDEKRGATLLKEVSLFEVSIVSMAMNERARVEGVKAAVDQEILDKLTGGERLTEREFERMVKGLGLSNSQAERAARVHLKGPGEPVKANDALAFLAALKST
jgi:hypothetical protein